MGFEGNAVTPQIKKLIEEDHIGSILLTAKNLKCNAQPAPLALSSLTFISRRADNTTLLGTPEDRT